MNIYKKFVREGVPEYLARHYWWAYLWEKSIWFFDHQAIINAILFGQYDALLRKTLAQVETKPNTRLLQLTCVYGKLTPSLLQHSSNEIHLCDIAIGQINLAKSKTSNVSDRCLLARMNAESLAYADDVFDQVIVFFLLHELPPAARQNVYDEIARVVKPDGSVLITEYAATPLHHFLFRLLPSRWLISHLEPFLLGFWKEDVTKKIATALVKRDKAFSGQPYLENCFDKFYRVLRINLG